MSINESRLRSNTMRKSRRSSYRAHSTTVKPNANGRFPHNQNVLDSHHNHGFAATAAEDEEFRLTMANFGHGNVFRDATQDSPGKEFL
jgi:hypothetical protein